MSAAPAAVRTAIDYTLRQDRGRLIAALTGAIGDFSLAEECLQDAIEAALNDWSNNGIPKSRRGWLLQVARRKALDQFRRAKNFKKKAAEIAILEQAEFDTPNDIDDIPDHRLRLIFICCHPALDAKTRVALTLRTIGGLTTDEIARAFLDKPSTMGQRLARARSKISKANIAYEIPEGMLFNERISSVLSVIYLIYNEGYSAAVGDAPMRIDLCEEAIFLARLMQKLKPDVPEVSGLLALILLTHSRRRARYLGQDYVPLSEHDRSLWDGKNIKQGVEILEAALKLGQVGPFQIQASISALHCEAKTADETDWAQITGLYKMLSKMQQNDIVELNLAVAMSYCEGGKKALVALQKIAQGLSKYHPYHAAKADILHRLGCVQDAKIAYSKAIELATNQSEIAYLVKKSAKL